MTQAPSTPKPGPEPDAPDLSEGWGEQRSRLRRDLRRLDVLFFLICTPVGLDTIGSVAAQGPQGLTWMAILALVFFLLYGLLVAELGSAFPVQGGPYVWTHLAFRRLFWPGVGVGWFGTAGSAADSLPESFAGQRLQYTLSQVVPLALFVGIGLAFYAAGARTRREKG